MSIGAATFIFWMAMASLCAAVAANKGRSFFGFFVYGLLIWPVALVHALVMQSAVPPQQPTATPSPPWLATPAAAEGQADTRDCPHCAETIKRAARVCKHCGRDVEPLPAPIAPPVTRPCPSCGEFNPTSRLICRVCRNNLEPWSPPA